jgi:hypothetical protein
MSGLLLLLDDRALECGTPVPLWLFGSFIYLWILHPNIQSGTGVLHSKIERNRL